MNWWEDQRTWSLNTFLEKMTLCDVWKLFSYVFLWSWRSKGSAVLKFERCEHEMTLFRRCEVLIINCLLCWKTKLRRYRHTLAKYRVRVFFKGTSTIKSLLMHPKDPIPDAHKTDIIYHWKCPANNCTAEYIGETNKSLKERVSDHRIQTSSAIRNYHISTKHLKAELKDFTLIDRESNKHRQAS